MDQYTQDELLGFVKASSNRKKILLTLKSGDMTPSEVARITNIALSNVTKIMGDLRKKNLIVCKTPRLRKGRIYTLTEKGQEIINLMSK